MSMQKPIARMVAVTRAQSRLLRSDTGAVRLVADYVVCAQPDCTCNSGVAAHGPFWRVHWSSGTRMWSRYLHRADARDVARLCGREQEPRLGGRRVRACRANSRWMERSSERGSAQEVTQRHGLGTTAARG